MANTIRIKKRSASGDAGAPSSLASSELAFNENASDLKLYYGYGDNGSGVATSIKVIGGEGGFFNKTDVRTANTILSGPTTGSAAAPTFRALVAADIPSIAHTKISDFDAGVQVNTLNSMAAPDGAVSLNSQKITNLATCIADTDAANKGYVDSLVEGLDVKQSVVVATTANGNIASDFNTGDSVDGITLTTDARILLKNQSTASQNGIYTVNTSGAPTRATDLPTGADAAAAFVFVEQGTTNADTGWVCTTNKGSAVVGTNDLAFAQFSGGGTITAGDGLDKSGNELSLDLKANGGCVIESAELAINLGASSITGTLAVGDGGTGSTSAENARTALGLAIGSNVQAHNAQLDEIAALAVTNGGFIVGNGSAFVLETGATARTSLGLAIGSDVQAYDAQLAAIAALAVTDGGVIVGNGSTFVLETGSTARTSLGIPDMTIDGGTY